MTRLSRVAEVRSALTSECALETSLISLKQLILLFVKHGGVINN